MWSNVHAKKTHTQKRKQKKNGVSSNMKDLNEKGKTKRGV